MPTRPWSFQHRQGSSVTCQYSTLYTGKQSSDLQASVRSGTSFGARQLAPFLYAVSVPAPGGHVSRLRIHTPSDTLPRQPVQCERDGQGAKLAVARAAGNRIAIFLIIHICYRGILELNLMMHFPLETPSDRRSFSIHPSRPHATAKTDPSSSRPAHLQASLHIRLTSFCSAPIHQANSISIHQSAPLSISLEDQLSFCPYPSSQLHPSQASGLNLPRSRAAGRLTGIDRTEPDRSIELRGVWERNRSFWVITCDDLDGLMKKIRICWDLGV